MPPSPGTTRPFEKPSTRHSQSMAAGASRYRMPGMTHDFPVVGMGQRPLRIGCSKCPRIARPRALAFDVRFDARQWRGSKELGERGKGLHDSDRGCGTCFTKSGIRRFMKASNIGTVNPVSPCRWLHTIPLSMRRWRTVATAAGRTPQGFGDPAGSTGPGAQLRPSPADTSVPGASTGRNEPGRSCCPGATPRAGWRLGPCLG